MNQQQREEALLSFRSYDSTVDSKSSASLHCTSRITVRAFGCGVNARFMLFFVEVVTKNSTTKQKVLVLIFMDVQIYKCTSMNLTHVVVLKYTAPKDLARVTHSLPDAYRSACHGRHGPCRAWPRRQGRHICN